jgi:F-type H+-transporting ATPase subunit epsilon
MPASFSLQVYSSDATLYNGDAVLVTVPAASGSYGIMAHHAPFIAMLTDGTIMIKDAHGLRKEVKARGAGFLEVADNAAVILLEGVSHA